MVGERGCHYGKLQRTQRKVIREILKYVYEHKSLPESAYDWDTAAIVKECVDKNFLGNIETTTCLDGRVHISAACPFVTAQALSFCANHRTKRQPTEDWSGV